MPNKMYLYPCSNSNWHLSADEIREIDDPLKINLMKDWFNYHFEDPALNTYYIPGSGYFYINGGPFAPRDVLIEEFNNIVSEKIIGDLAKELCQIRKKWAPISGSNYHRDNQKHFPPQEFINSIRNIENLLSAKTPPSATSSMHRLLYTNIITAIEVYLSDTFKDEIIYEEIFDFLKNITNIKDHDNNYQIIWHKLYHVNKRHKDIYGTEFPENLKIICRAVLVCHDIIHRNGCTKQGKYYKINETVVTDLINKTIVFMYCIEDRIKPHE